MNWINFPRGSGKTKMLIQTAYATGYPIITWEHGQADAISDTAHRMGLIVTVIPVSEYINHYHWQYDKVLLDEADKIVESALTSMLRAEVIAATVSIPMIHANLDMQSGGKE